MALLYFRDAAKLEPGKNWMGKAAVRHMLSQRDETIKVWENEARNWLELTLESNARLRAAKASFDQTNKVNTWLIRGLIGYNILLTVIWGASSYSN